MVSEHETADTVAVLEVGTSSGEGDLDTCWTPWDKRCKSAFSNTEQGFVYLKLDGVGGMGLLQLGRLRLGLYLEC